MKTSTQPHAAPARIHLRIKHPKLDPSEITRILAMTPEHTLDADRHAASSAAESYWIAPLTLSMFEGPWLGFDEREHARESDIAASALEMMAHETFVGLALRRLQPHQRFFRTIVDDGGTATLLINTNTAGSMTIPPSLARKLADLGLALELDWSSSAE